MATPNESFMGPAIFGGLILFTLATMGEQEVVYLNPSETMDIEAVTQDDGLITVASLAMPLPTAEEADQNFVPGASVMLAAWREPSDVAEKSLSLAAPLAEQSASMWTSASTVVALMDDVALPPPPRETAMPAQSLQTARTANGTDRVISRLSPLAPDAVSFAPVRGQTSVADAMDVTPQMPAEADAPQATVLLSAGETVPALRSALGTLSLSDPRAADALVAPFANAGPPPSALTTVGVPPERSGNTFTRTVAPFQPVNQAQPTLLPLPPRDETVAFAAPLRWRIIIGQSVNVRTGPDLSAERITQFNSGRRVIILEELDDWSWVNWPSQSGPITGWMSNDYLFADD